MSPISRLASLLAAESIIVPVSGTSTAIVAFLLASSQWSAWATASDRLGAASRLAVVGVGPFQGNVCRPDGQDGS